MRPMIRPVLYFVALVGALAGCDDETPPVPDAGPTGPQVAAAGAITASISAVAVLDDRLRVDFELRDAAGAGLVGLTAEQVFFTLARLDGDGWRAVVHRPAALDDVARPAADTGGELTVFGAGRYTYAFADPVTDLGALAGEPWRPEDVHRVGLYLAPDLAPANATFDVVPATGAPTPGRRVTSTAACNACHSQLAHHGGARRDVALCVTCHTAGATGPGGASLAFDAMVHRIHMGLRLPSVQAGGTHVLVDGDGTPHDRSRLTLPMRISNCTACHDGARDDAPDGDRWRTTLDRAACGACHDDIDFTLGEGEEGAHPGGPQLDDAECAGCHTADGEAGSVAASHARPALDWAGRFVYEVVSIVDTAPGQRPRITYRVTDADGAPYDLQADIEFTAPNVRLMLDLSWSSWEHGLGNLGPPPASPLELDALTGTPNGDGTYTIQSPEPVPADATGTGTLVFEGHPMGDYQDDGSYIDAVPVRSVVVYFTITDPEPVPRRVVVDEAKCLGCHGPHDGLARHGGNRVDDIRVCVTCHNPRNTDLAQRPTDPDGTHDGANATAVDGLEQRSVDFNLMVHAIHGAQMRATPFVLYGYLNLPHDFSDVRFPGDLGRCETCHLPETYTLPVAGARLPRTVDSGATVTFADFFGRPMLDDVEAARDPADDLVTTPTAAACSGCHDGADTVRHMIEHGAGVAVPAATAADLGERCVDCHGRDGPFAVELVHRPGRWTPPE